MPQTLEEFARGTPFAAEVSRLRAVEVSAREVISACDTLSMWSTRWCPIVLQGPADRLRKAVERAAGST